MATHQCKHGAVSHGRVHISLIQVSLYYSTSQGGPSPRSCHKICFDPDTKSIFVLGRFIESSVAMTTNLESDFYRYFVEYDQWVKISDNTGVRIT